MSDARNNDDRDARLAQALRDNLKRRKQQAKARRAPPADSGDAAQRDENRGDTRPDDDPAG